jgi:putative iron-dependent peroxidase
VLDALLTREIDGWSYKHSRYLSGFEDGTENPALMIAPSIATIPDGRPGAGGSVVLFQQWEHHAKEWDSLPVPDQEKVIGRTKLESVEFSEAVQLETSHVSRTTVEMEGREHKIFRRNTAYGNATAHGTVFVGFSQDRDRLEPDVAPHGRRRWHSRRADALLAHCRRSPRRPTPTSQHEAAKSECGLFFT